MNPSLLVGKTEVDAIKEIEAAGFEARVTRRDTDVVGGIHNMSRSRVNLEIDDGVVTVANIG